MLVVLSVRGQTVRLGFTGSREVPILRVELLPIDQFLKVMEGRGDGRSTELV